MDKELKELQRVICLGCPCYVDDLGYQICEPDMKTCDIEYCDTREAFNKVKAAYENMKVSRDFYKENYEAWING